MYLYLCARHRVIKTTAEAELLKSAEAAQLAKEASLQAELKALQLDLEKERSLVNASLAAQAKSNEVRNLSDSGW